LGHLRELAVRAVDRLQTSGFTAYWAGGCVRAMLLGAQPKDYDIATSATPAEVQQVFPDSVAVGKSFGVVRVRVEDAWFEVATFRRDFSYRDGRRPEGVSFADPETDVQRRDFTINALFFDPVTEQLHDYADGKKDIEAGIVRCVGKPQERFREDHLRMLRAVRFASAPDFSLDGETADAIRDNAALIQRISPERIRDELTRILCESPQAGDALVLLDGLRLLEHILPEVKAMQGQEQPPQFHPEGDVFQHTVDMLNLMSGVNAALAFAVLLHDVGKPCTARHTPLRIRFDGHASRGADITRAVMTRLRFSNEDVDTVCRSVGNHMHFMDVKRMRPATLRRLIGKPSYHIELELHRLDCLASHGGLDNYDFLREFEEQIRKEPVLPPPWVTGHDILELGVPEGPEVGEWHRRAYDAQLNGEHKSREDLIKWLKEEVRRN